MSLASPALGLLLVGFILLSLPKWAITPASSWKVSTLCVLSSLHCHSPQSSPPRRGNLTPISLPREPVRAGRRDFDGSRGTKRVSRDWEVLLGGAERLGNLRSFFHQPPLPLPGQSSVALQVPSTCLTHQLGPCNFPFPEVTLAFSALFHCWNFFLLQGISSQPECSGLTSSF